MKKGIIIAILFCSIIMCSKVNASTSTYQSRTLQLSEVNYMELMGNDLRNNIEQFNVNSNYWIGLNRLSGNKIPVSQTNKKFTLRSDRFYNANFDYVYFNLYTMITVCSSGGNNALCSEISGARPTFSFNNLPCEIIDYSETIIGDSSSSNGGRSIYQNISYKCPNTSGGGYIQAYFDNFNYNYMYARIGINRTIWYSNLGLTDNAAIIEAIRGSNAGVMGAIEGQTQQIIESNTTYNQNATQDFTNETQEVENYTQAEQDLMNDLEFNTTDMNITINPNASQFIWNIVDGLRSINGAIVLLMTSLLSIGVIKLVLGR